MLKELLAMFGGTNRCWKYLVYTEVLILSSIVITTLVCEEYLKYGSVHGVIVGRHWIFGFEGLVLCLLQTIRVTCWRRFGQDGTPLFRIGVTTFLTTTAWAGTVIAVIQQIFLACDTQKRWPFSQLLKVYHRYGICAKAKISG